MRYAPRALLAGGLGLAVSFLVACGGGSGLLSSDQANTLNSQLDQVSSAVGAGQCGVASGAATSFNNAVYNLPSTVNATLANNLKQGAATVSELTSKDCRTQTTPTPTTTSTASTNTTTTPTTPTQTTPSVPSTPSSTPIPPATTPTNPGTTSTGTGSGGAGIGSGGGATNGGGGTGAGNANGNGQ